MTADELFTLLLLLAIVSGVLMVAALVADAITRYRSRQALDRDNAKLDRLNMGGLPDRRKPGSAPNAIRVVRLTPEERALVRTYGVIVASTHGRHPDRRKMRVIK